MKKTKGILSASFILLFSSFAIADIIHIPDDYPTIQQGLISATEGDTVLVAPSTYYENLFWPATNGITLLSEAGADSTIIDGSNLSTVIYIYSAITIDTTTVIDAFTMRNGTAEAGGGIACVNASPLIKNCIVAANEGGGLAFTNSSPVLRNNEISNNNGIGIKCVGNSDLTISDCEIEDNSGSGIYFDSSSGTILGCSITGNSAADGGGIYCYDSSLSLENVTISGNSTSSYDGGGGIYCDDSNIILINVDFYNNTSSYIGGGMYCYESSAILNEVDFIYNSAVNGGGGMHTFHTSATLTNVTFRENSAEAGGGFYCSGSGNPQLINCMLISNTAGNGGGIYSTTSFEMENVTICNNTAIQSNENGNGGGIYCSFLFGSSTWTNIVISSNSADDCGGGIYLYELDNINSDLSLTNVIITGNIAPSGAGIYCEDNSSPNLENVTITLNLANIGGAMYCTDNSNPSIEHCTITENSAEEEGDGIYTEDSSEPTFHYSNIMLNGYGIYNADQLLMIDASNCFWGDATGPYHEFWNPGGLGDSVNQYVNPLPFLTEADTTAPPIPPIGMDTLAVWEDSVSIFWLPSPIGDLAGYKVYFDSDLSGFPYSDTVDVGLDTTHTLTNLTIGTTYYISVTCYDNSGEESWYSREIEVIPGGVGVDENVLPLHKSFYLSQNYPNPFNPKTTISFSIPKESKVEISIYNIKGQKVSTLAKRDFEKGIHRVTWDGKDNIGKLVSSGIYFYKMETDNFSEIKKAILLK